MFHLSTNPDLPRLYPRVPNNIAVSEGREDATTRRVCMAPSIRGSISSIRWEYKEVEYWVYVPERWRRWDEVYAPSEERVFDQWYTGEVWYTNPEGLLLRRIGKVLAYGGVGKGEDMRWREVYRGY